MKHPQYRRVWWLISLLVTLGCLSAPIEAQVNSGTITGVVVDSSKAVIPLAQIQVGMDVYQPANVTACGHEKSNKRRWMGWRRTKPAR